jgi:hypothetical protein
MPTCTWTHQCRQPAPRSLDHLTNMSATTVCTCTTNEVIYAKTHGYMKIEPYHTPHCYIYISSLTQP